VDAGGGKLDLVVHEKVDDSGVRVEEVARSVGDLCGGTYVDKAFFGYRSEKIGCLRKFRTDFPATSLTLTRYWEDIKCDFRGESKPYEMDLPASLAKAWEAYERMNDIWCEDSEYDTVIIIAETMEKFFGGEVNKIFKLITYSPVYTAQTIRTLLLSLCPTFGGR
jgi:hypothetical protein